MNYSFATAKNQVSIQLDDYSFIYKNNEEEHIIRYAQINEVRMKRPKSVDNENRFSCTIYITDGPVIHLQSYSVENNEVKNHFNHYSQFIRVFHFYLISKSKAKFRYGMSYRNMIIHAMLLIAAIAGCYFMTFMLREHILFIYSIVPVVLLFSITKVLTDKPGSYRPDIIPYHILPGIS